MDNTTTIHASVHASPTYFVPLSQLRTRLSPTDRLDVADLVTRFEWCYDTRNFEALVDMLTPDCILDDVWGYALKDAMRAFNSYAIICSPTPGAVTTVFCLRKPSLNGLTASHRPG
jgi:hypothetical protein